MEMQVDNSPHELEIANVTDVDLGSRNISSKPKSKPDLNCSITSVDDLACFRFDYSSEVSPAACNVASVSTPTNEPRTIPDFYQLSRRETNKSKQSSYLPSNDSVIDNSDRDAIKIADSNFSTTPKKSLILKNNLVGKERKSQKQEVGKQKRKRSTALVKDVDSIEKIPFWVSPPKDVSEIPGYAKAICTRLVYVEKQIQKFNAERQGLLCSLWRLNNDGFGHFLPQSIFDGKKIASTEDDRVKVEKVPTDTTPSISMHGPDVVTKLEEKQDKTIIPGNLDMSNVDIWKSCWLDGQNYPSSTPSSPLSITQEKSDFSIRLNKSEIGETSECLDSNKETLLHTNEVIQVSDSDDSVDNLDPIEYFKELDFNNLTHEGVNTWTQFFGLKVCFFWCM
ncbi:hypothetical protein BdWA1_003238 [Babesia duncani]|uniref:Uncharacterized protein n=1 Tax=Babesia duncani TaxID=323732 RepID=A0AAD9PIQ9_9APIC|nr:hypothetical protein BdWA1_003238 [Babesia duncani]